VAGIVNGTTFILSEMRDKGLDFGTVLKEAQRLGYESDPTFDIEGSTPRTRRPSCAPSRSACRCSSARRTSSITARATDIRYAEQLGYRIKRRVARRAPLGIELRVHPTLIPAKRLIANVQGAIMPVIGAGRRGGHHTLYGKGAAPSPRRPPWWPIWWTSRGCTADPDHRVPHLAFRPDALASTPILSMGGWYRLHLRLRVADQTGVLSRITPSWPSTTSRSTPCCSANPLRATPDRLHPDPRHPRGAHGPGR
jgi:homoserine dehydrogenase